MTELHAIILTLNEERHIARCIESIRSTCQNILVVDSGSSDGTANIARDLGAETIVNPFVNHATQVNFGISALAGESGWLLRIDADEYLTPDSAAMLTECIDSISPDIDGLLVRRQIVFLGRRIRWGGVEPSWQLRLWRAGRGQCEQRWMDEHVHVEGKVARSDIEVVDENLNSLDWWINKHNGYASREAIDILASRGLLPANAELSQHGASLQAAIKRHIKDKIYNRLPGGLRSMAYFLYRYILRLGFLDGRAGYYFHVLQGLWYRTLVDAKVAEIEAFATATGTFMRDAVLAKTGIDPFATLRSGTQPVDGSLVAINSDDAA